MKCDQCRWLRINGVFCHENGCPNANSRWDDGMDMWVKQRKCFHCGYECDIDDPCCDEPKDGFDLWDSAILREV